MTFHVLARPVWPVQVVNFFGMAILHPPWTRTGDIAVPECAQGLIFSHWYTGSTRHPFYLALLSNKWNKIPDFLEKKWRVFFIVTTFGTNNPKTPISRAGNCTHLASIRNQKTLGLVSRQAADLGHFYIQKKGLSQESKPAGQPLGESPPEGYLTGYCSPDVQ